MAPAVRYGDEKGVPVVLVGGRFPANEMSTVTMLKTLPALIHLSAADVQNARALSSYLPILGHEAERPRTGANLIRHHVAQVMLVHAIRMIFQREEEMKAEQLHGMVHPRIGPVLRVGLAKQLLASGQASLSKIARDIGYVRECIQ